MSYRTWIELNQSAVRYNINQLRSLLAPGVTFCAVVKANAYGHGAKEMIKIIVEAGVNTFAVDSFDEAQLVRSLLPEATIIILGYTLKESYEDAVRNSFQLTVYEKNSLLALESAAARQNKDVGIHLKIETGTCRQGVIKENLKDILDTLQKCPHLQLIGVATHFATLDDTNDTAFAKYQLDIFHESCAAIAVRGFKPKWRHCACSSGIILYPDTHENFVRAGIAIYGLWPSTNVEGVVHKHTIRCDLTPVLTWKTRVAQIKPVAAGAPVGYSLTERVKRDSRIAILPVGYYDGYDRKLSSVGEVLINGYRCKVLGRVCMNMCMVDVSAVPHVEPEDEVVLLGRSGHYTVSAEEIAAKIGTISYEVVARINPSLPRIVV